jgi:hypothetical protein
MTQRTLPTRHANASTPWESYFVLGSVAILGGLAVADRFTAWLIGQFPTSTLLWHIRLEYLRPIGVYHDLVELNLGYWSPFGFSMLVIAAAALVAGGAWSKVRLARAVSYHLLFGAGALLVVLCFNSDPSTRAWSLVGTPSTPYALFGGLMASIAVIPCLRVHAEYLGWDAGSSKALRRLQISFARLRSNLESAVIEVIAPLNPAPGQVRAAPIRQRAARGRNLDAQ